MRLRKGRLIFPLIMIVCLGGFMFLHFSSSKSHQEVSLISASWSYRYYDVQEMAKESDLIALIRVDSLIECTEDQQLPFSTFAVEVVQPVYGCKEGQTINIIMTGGESGKQRIEIKDDPMLEKGQEFLVFARHNETGTYTILGGPQGRLAFRDGKLNSMQYVTERVSKDSININIHDEALEVIIKEINAVRD